MKTIERLRELLKAGTPLPWQSEPEVYCHGETHAIAVWNPVDGHCRVMVANGNFPDVAKADAAKARAAVNHLPALLAVVEAAAKLNKAIYPTIGADARSRWIIDADSTAPGELDVALRALEGGAGDTFTLPSVEEAFNPTMLALNTKNNAIAHQAERISALEAQVKALTEERDAQAEAVRVLGEECEMARVCVEPDPIYGWKEPRHLESHYMDWQELGKMREQTDANPIARAAVEGEKR